MFGWDPAGSVELNDMMCAQNEAGENGGCFFSAGRGIVNGGTVMRGNLAGSGGCICEKCLSFLKISKAPNVRTFHKVETLNLFVKWTTAYPNNEVV